MATGFFWAEECFWHGGGNFAGNTPVGGFVQPLAAGGLPEHPESKRRLKNLIDVSGLSEALVVQGAERATDEDIARIHPWRYIQDFKELSAGEGGNLGLRSPFGPGGYDIAARSAGLAKRALFDVLQGRLANAYALSRPPGHHCLPDWPNGFCLLANISIAIAAARAAGLCRRVAILDWDVHHGNGAEAIHLEDTDTLTVSLHQERNYPLDTGGFEVRGARGTNLNIPLPPGTGHVGYLDALDRLAIPAIRAFRPEVVIVACGYDASMLDTLGRMLATAETFGAMTDRVMDLTREVCDGRLVMVHEGGYSEVYVPFCGHRVLERMAGTGPHVPDPFEAPFRHRQPTARFDAYVAGLISEMAEALGSDYLSVT